MNMNFSVGPGGPPNVVVPTPQKPAPRPTGSYFALARQPLMFGLISAVVLFVIFGGWAATAPLVGGATASGVVSPDSSRRAIQHLEGGIVQSVFVKEGQQVRQGDPLVTLDPIRAQATFSARREQWLRLLIIAARLDALALNRDQVTLPQELEKYPTAGLTDFASSQLDLFEARRNGIDQQEQILQRQIDQAQNEISSINSQNAGLKKQAALIGEELDYKVGLLAKNLISKSDILALQREEAQLESNVAANEARIAQTEQAIEEIRLKLLQARDQFRDQVAQEATDTNDKIASIEEEMVATGDILNRTELYSPVDGTVINLRTPTPGGVVRGGEPIMEIVPLNDELIIVAKLNPRFIDLVHEGLPAHVQLVPFQNRNTLPLIGTVVQVGADAQLDEVTRQSYYEVRVKISAEEVTQHPGMYLGPGMPAEVIIVTKERTMLDYLLEPVVRTLRTAFVYD